MGLLDEKFINTFKFSMLSFFMMTHYAKGSRAERELIDFFSSNGFSVIRAAGSGVSSLCPDILVFKRGMQYAIEAKAWENEYLHINKEQFLNLKRWEENTGINCYIGWRRNRKEWLLIPLSIFEETEKGKSFAVSWKQVEGIGRRLEELII